MFKLSSVLLLGCGLSAFAAAQSYSSFNQLTSLSGVTVSPSNSLDYNVSLSSGATMKWNGQVFDVTQVFGFFQLSSTDSLGSPTGSDFSNWKFVTKSGNSGQIAGWDHSSNNGRINAGGSQQFDYKSITPSHEYGFHLTYLVNGAAKTAYFIAPQPAPEPASMIGLGAGVLGVLKLRRRRQSA